MKNEREHFIVVVVVVSLNFSIPFPCTLIWTIPFSDKMRPPVLFIPSQNTLLLITPDSLSVFTLFPTVVRLALVGSTPKVPPPEVHLSEAVCRGTLSETIWKQDASYGTRTPAVIPSAHPKHNEPIRRSCLDDTFRTRHFLPNCFIFEVKRRRKYKSSYNKTILMQENNFKFGIVLRNHAHL